jgi:3-(3-hydroxy-phenyl)propionate hydroxylase
VGRSRVKTARVIVVGAGPVGAVAALEAIRRGFLVTLLERTPTVDATPRASTFHPSTLEMLSRLAIFERFVSVGLTARWVDFWDKPSRTLVARFDHAVLRDDTPFPFVVQTEQHKLVNLALDHLASVAKCDVHRSTPATAVRQTEEKAVVVAETPEGTREFEGDFVVACDGGRSDVRKALGIDFPGYTWPERFIVLTTLTAFDEILGCSLRSYFADPDEWTNLFKVAGDDGNGRWRAVFPARVGESDDEALGAPAIDRRLSRLVPGAADRLVHKNLYTVHQRVASTFRSGRVFLAGDAAHVNNPIGGLGLNCGIHDVVELVSHLEAVAFGGADPTLLDRYERRRRPLIIEFVQQQTVSNKERLEAQSAEARRARQAELAKLAGSEETQRAFLLRSSLLSSVRQAQQIA